MNTLIWWTGAVTLTIIAIGALIGAMAAFNHACNTTRFTRAVLKAAIKPAWYEKPWYWRWRIAFQRWCYYFNEYPDEVRVGDVSIYWPGDESETHYPG